MCTMRYPVPIQKNTLRADPFPTFTFRNIITKKRKHRLHSSATPLTSMRQNYYPPPPEPVSVSEELSKDVGVCEKPKIEVPVSDSDSL